MKNTITKKKYSVGCYHKECGKGESQLTESN